VSHDRAGPVAVLVGAPGAGVAETAEALARLLALPLRDTDDDVARQAGTPVADLFLAGLEDRFRALERAAALAALREHPGVLALGGGAVLDPAVAAALAAAPVVLLDVEVADAARRLGFDRERPAALGSPRALWTRLLQQRRPAYVEVADLVVAVGSRSPEQVAAEIAAALPLPGRPA
jgi:shikimate kinase